MLLYDYLEVKGRGGWEGRKLKVEPDGWEAVSGRFKETGRVVAASLLLISLAECSLVEEAGSALHGDPGAAGPYLLRHLYPNL
jgi:hypothetical protein